MAVEEKDLHIVMAPYMAQGHIIPFLALAKLILQRNPSCKITFVSTPLNIQSLQTSLSISPNISLHALPFRAADHGLPPDTENTDSLPRSYIRPFMLASQSLEPHFDRLISDLTERSCGRTRVCVVADVLLAWTVTVAERHGAFHATFNTCGAYGTLGYMSAWLNIPRGHLQTGGDEFRLPGFPETCTFHHSQLPPNVMEVSEHHPFAVFFRKIITLAFKSGAMLCNTVAEVESVGVQLFTKFAGVKMWTIGPLLPLGKKSSPSPRNGRSSGIDLEACTEWLDARPNGSVVYVSFGSQNSIAASQMMELAKGLEASGKPFIWVVRPPIEFDSNGHFRDEWLPEGFEERVTGSGQGLIVRKWAPQLEILSHQSTGLFLSHCGWNSTLESLSRGVPVIGWPLGAEQSFNIKMMEEELGVGVELARGVKCKIESRDVARAIGLGFDDEKGRSMREKAAAIAKMIGDSMNEVEEKGSSLSAIDDFLDVASARRTTDEECRV